MDNKFASVLDGLNSRKQRLKDGDHMLNVHLHSVRGVQTRRKQGQVVRMHRGRISARRCAHHYPLTRREPQMRRNIVRMHLGGTDAKSNVTTWLRLRHGCVRSNALLSRAGHDCQILRRCHTASARTGSYVSLCCCWQPYFTKPHIRQVAL